MKAILCAAGSGSRWANYTGRRKHMAHVEGEALLERTTRQLRERGVTDVTITQITAHPYHVKGAKAAFMPSGVAHSTSRKHTWKLWDTDGATLLLLGDAWFSDAAVNRIVGLGNREPDTAYYQVGRLKASDATGKPGPEMFGWVLGRQRHHEFIAAVEVVETMDLAGLPTSNDWTIYQAMCGRDLNAKADQIEPGPYHLELPDDGTDDMDFPDDYERWLTRMRGRSARRIHAAQFADAWLENRTSEMGLAPKLHRKRWEHAAIAQTYLDRFGSGGTLLGFGVGKERLPAWFASQGATVLATDRPDAGLWLERQHAKGLGELVREGICTEEEFKRVNFRALDMRNLPLGFLNGGETDYTLFDMLWSSSTIEHLGGISAGLQFFVDSMRFLKPGGIAVHTTEFNVKSNDKTIQEENLCVFRKQDFQLLAARLEEQGDRLWPIDLSEGTTHLDKVVDTPPFTNDVHIHLELGGCTFTSVLLIAMRGHHPV